MKYWPRDKEFKQLYLSKKAISNKLKWLFCFVGNTVQSQKNSLLNLLLSSNEGKHQPGDTRRNLHRFIENVKLLASMDPVTKPAEDDGVEIIKNLGRKHKE